jgi:hypothetical protein
MRSERTCYFLCERRRRRRIPSAMREQLTIIGVTLDAMTESQQPNPFSREGSSPAEGLGSDPSPGQATPPYQQPSDGSNDQYAGNWPSYPAADPYRTPPTDPYGRPTSSYGRPAGSYGSPSPDATYSVPVPGLDSQTPPPYGDPGSSYGGSSSYGNPYEVNPYRPDFGGVSPYGVAPTPMTPHPQATLALVLGILGTVLGLSCIVGGLVGIGGIVVGRRVRNEIDADPGRYTGRSQAVAGFVMGIIGVSIPVLATLFLVLAIIGAISSSNF